MDPRPPTRQAIHSLHSLSRLPGNVDQLEHLELGLLDMQVAHERLLPSPPLRTIARLSLVMYPTEEQDVHVPGFAGGGGTKRLCASADREVHLPPAQLVCYRHRRTYGPEAQSKHGRLRPHSRCSGLARRPPGCRPGAAEKASPPNAQTQQAQGSPIHSALVLSLIRDSTKTEKLMVLKSKLRPFGYREFLEINMKIEPISPMSNQNPATEPELLRW